MNASEAATYVRNSIRELIAALPADSAARRSLEAAAPRLNREASEASEWWDEMQSRPPEARVERVGRWTYSVSITHGVMSRGYWNAWGRDRAERKARRKLASYVRRESYRYPVSVVKSAVPVVGGEDNGDV
jgi:hypothetical protein